MYFQILCQFSGPFYKQKKTNQRALPKITEKYQSVPIHYSALIMITVLNENNNYLNIDTIEDRPDLVSLKLSLLFLISQGHSKPFSISCILAMINMEIIEINISSSLCGDIKIDHIAVRFSVFLWCVQQ